MLDVAVGDRVGDVGGQLGIGRAVADEEQVGVGRAGDLELLEGDGGVGARAVGRGDAITVGARLGSLARNGGRDGASANLFAEVVCSATGRRTESDWMSLIWVARNWSASGGTDWRPGRRCRRAPAVDIDGGGGFVDGGEARGNHHGGDDGDEDEGEDLPPVALEDPEIVGERDGGFLGLGVGVAGGGAV